MAAKISTALRNAILGAAGDDLATVFAPVFIYFYDGIVPTSAENAKDAGSTLLLKISADTPGTIGGTWDAAVNGAVPKLASETWDGLIAVSGTPTFFRICMGTDNGSTASTTFLRWQDTAGGPGNAVVFTDPAFVANGTNRKGLSIFELQIPGS